MIFKLLLNIQKNISQNINIFLNILFGEINISNSSQIFFVNVYMNIYQNIHMNIYMNIHMPSDRITRATSLAWTRKFDENLNEAWSDEDED